MDHEAYVRSRWRSVKYEDHTECCGPFEPHCVRMFETRSTWAATEAEAWQAACEFTVQREEEIRQVEEEKAFLIKHLDWTEPPHGLDEEARLGRIIVDRNLGRLQAHLDSLRVGMKTVEK